MSGLCISQFTCMAIGDASIETKVPSQFAYCCIS